MQFTLEEIYLIRSINSKDKKMIIYELKKIHRKIDDSAIVEMANNVLKKLNKVSEKEFAELMNYPL